MKAFLHPDEQHFDFQWNIDTTVGLQGQNTSRVDVEYIQFYYKLASTQPETPPERRAVYRNVAVNGVCRGTRDDPLVQAILIHQAALEHPIVDGKVSVAKAGVRLGPNGTAFFVLRLGARIARMFPQFWPRLDLIPGCPAGVAAASKLAVPVIPTAP